jgi:hypothetical protein
MLKRSKLLKKVFLEHSSQTIYFLDFNYLIDRENDYERKVCIPALKQLSRFYVVVNFRA